MSGRACVRCGRRPRELDTFLCLACLEDPATHAETRAGLAQPDDLAARRFMIERYGWAGGWGAPGRERARA